jgi:hypothetical protein
MFLSNLFCLCLIFALVKFSKKLLTDLLNIHIVVTNYIKERITRRTHETHVLSLISIIKDDSKFLSEFPWPIIFKPERIK